MSKCIISTLDIKKVVFLHTNCEYVYYLYINILNKCIISIYTLARPARDSRSGGHVRRHRPVALHEHHHLLIQISNLQQGEGGGGDEIKRENYILI